MVQLILITALATSGAVPAFATETHRFNVPVEGAVDAIRDFAAQARVQILADGENVKDKHLHPVLGVYSTDKGLSVLLTDSGLKPQYVGDHSIALVTLAQESPDADAGSQSRAGAREGKKSAFGVAPMDQGTASSTPSVDSSSSSPASGSGTTGEVLEQIVVTAQKRSEHLKDVPIPVSVINPEVLTDSGQLLLRDYYTSVPGLTLSPNAVGEQMLSIRGITTGGFTNPTVGVMVDDLPYGGSTDSTGGSHIPDIDPSDLDHIEVLRGPQGTLYGADSLGGLVKYVTTDPSTDGYSGRISSGVSSVYNGAEPGYNVRAAANVPLANNLAVRASGYTRQDPGYIDNPMLQMNGVNETAAYGGRLSALWRPTDGVSMKLSGWYQRRKTNGVPEVDVTPGLADLQQTYNYVPGPALDQTVAVFSAVLKAKLAGIDLTSLSGYNVNHQSTWTDFTCCYGPLTKQVFGVTDSAFYINEKIANIAQELRLASSVGQFDWLIGGFFTRQHVSLAQGVDALDPATRQVLGNYFNEQVPITLWEYAAFANFTYHFTDRFDVQVGGRESHIREIDPPKVETGPYITSFQGLAAPLITNQVAATGNAFTYLFTPQFKLSPDVMIYARLASGYRPGGPNNIGAGTGPAEYSPDKTENYDVGLKGDFFDRQLSVDASAYHIAWKNLQIQLRNSLNFTYLTNASAAKSDGLELSIQARPLAVPGLNVSAWVSYDQAVLTRSFPSTSPAYGVAGDRLPNTPHFSGNVAVNKHFPLAGGAVGFAGATVSYVGSRLSVFTDSARRQKFPSYTKTDFRAGVKYEGWTTNVYVNNVTDSRGILDGGLGYFISNAFIYIQPRTVGIDVAKTF